MSVHGERQVGALRGATTVERDDPALVRAATRELLEQIIVRNSILAGDIISVVFSVTNDLTSEYPARAARELGWIDVPLLCTTEIPVPGSLPRCIRVLLHLESTRPRRQLTSVFLNGTEASTRY
ncbi:MAG TPA: chorismate mutase [Gemmatimonadaceae bacterium]